MKKSLGLLTCGAMACGLFLGLAGVAPAEVVRTERGNLVMANVPEVPTSLAERMQQYLSIRSASVCGWLPGEQGMLIYTRFGDTTQLHKVATPGASRQQMTFFSEPVNKAIINPNPQRCDIIILKDIGGNENYQLYRYDIVNGISELISDGKSRYGTVVWNKDGDKIAYVSNQRNGKDWDVWITDPVYPENAKMVYKGEGNWSVLDWSANGNELLLQRYDSIVDSRLELLDLTTGKTKRLGCYPDFSTEDKFYIGDAVFSATGEKVYFTSNRGEKFNKLYEQRKGSGKVTPITPNIDWDVEDLCVSPDGRYLAFDVNAGGISELYLVDLRDGKNAYKRVDSLPKGVVTGLDFDKDGETLAVSINSSSSPGDVYTVDIDGNNVQRWTFSEVGGLDTKKFVEPTLISYPTFDKDGDKPRQIPAFVYMPKEAKGKVPVLINVHGGPESQYRPSFASLSQYLVNELGVAVIAPNVRGSSGYGSDYVNLDNGFKRMDSVKDIGALLDWIKTQPNLDASRVAVMGGSYGGFMTLAPLYVVQGANDPRVPLSEADQIVREVRNNGGDVWYIVASDEGHGFRKKVNRDLYMQTVVLFLKKYLVGE